MGRKNNAFTLVELMIVVSILAILAFIGIAYFRGQIFKGNDAKRKGDLNRIKIAVEEYEKDNNCYPQSVSCTSPTTLQPYLDQIPCDPATHTPYYYEPDISNPACARWYRIYARLENLTDAAITPGIGQNDNFYQSSSNAPPPAGTLPTNPAPPPPTPSAQPSVPPGFCGFYGCINGQCQALTLDPATGRCTCTPTYDNSRCNDSCSQPNSQCI